MELNLDQLKIILPSNKELGDWLPYLNDILPRYGITTEDQVAAFLAQTGHESIDYTVLEENLNYSTAALLKVFPNHFTPEEALKFERNPEKIADRVYANRMGNGNEESGDGWKFRGRGILQITGKDNYATLSAIIWPSAPDTLLAFPNLLSTTRFALESACIFWTKHLLHTVDPNTDFTHITQVINGGQNGAIDRALRFKKAKEAFILYP